MGNALGVVTALAAIGSSALINASYPLDRKAANWLALAILFWSQVVVGSIFLSELKAIGLPGLAIWHISVLCLAALLWSRSRKHRLSWLYRPKLKRLPSVLRNHAFLVVLTSALAVVLIVMVLPMVFVQSDAAHYHIPRAHYWIQNRTARHFYTDDIRQVERPPNSSFIYMWQILLTDSYAGLNIPQWLAAVWTAIAIGALARWAGHGRSASSFAAVLFLSLPTVTLQMSAPWNDLLSAFPTIAFVYLTLQGCLPGQRGDSQYSQRYIGYAGLAFGLMLGTKFTSLLSLPGLAIILGIALIVRFREMWRPLVILAANCGLGFVAVGSYNYVLNIVDFGKPIVSYEIEGAISAAPLSEAQTHSSMISDLVRHTYQVMDWTIVEEIPGADTLYALNNAAYQEADQMLNLTLESDRQFNIDDFGMRSIDPGETGFGPLGYTLILSAPLAFVGLLISSWRRRSHMHSLMVLSIGLAAFAVLPVVDSWAPTLTRYNVAAFALMAAAIVPFAYSRRTVALVWLVPVVLLALWCTSRIAARSSHFESEGRTLAPWQESVLGTALPVDAHIGVAGRVEFIHILRRFGSYSFKPVLPSEIASGLETGALDAALVLDPDDEFQKYRLPLEHDQSLLMRNPVVALVTNLNNYGATLESGNSSSLLQLLDSGLIRRIGPDLVQFFVPTVAPLTQDQPVIMEISFPVQAPASDMMKLTCNGVGLTGVTADRRLTVHIPLSVIDRSQATQICRLHIRDLEFGQQIPSREIEIRVYRSSQ